MLESYNPCTGELLRTYPAMSVDEAQNCIQASESSFQHWKLTSFGERAEKFKQASKILMERREAYSRLISLEMGKPINAARAEIEKCAWVCDYFADSAASMLTPEFFATDATRSYVAFQPLGVILAVMPWNYPFWQVFRFAAPALMAGNSAVLKHASNVTGCALAIEDVFRASGFPEHLFRCVRLTSGGVSTLIENPYVRAVTVTGSTRAGSAVASKAGQMLKKAVLELGGSDPYVILEDADLESTVEACVASRLLNSGQSCIAAKRFIVPRSLQKQFEDRLVDLMGSKRMGNPLDEDTEIGPLARMDLRDTLHGQVRESITRGAKCLLGGTLPDGPGSYYPPTVLSEVVKGMPAYDEETFGPVASVIVVHDEAEAVRIANDSTYGLGAAVFSRDDHHAEWLALSALEAGSCFVNAFVKSDPRLPFGGVKESGYGRELGIYGIREFVNIKTVYVR